jgi:hypothetical protein
MAHTETLIKPTPAHGQHTQLLKQGSDLHTLVSIVSDEPGLCATCMNIATCMYRKFQQQSVVYCEEFEIQPTIRKQRTTAVPTCAAEYQYRGLCMNCENRNSCMHADTEGGIWHCEEYR